MFKKILPSDISIRPFKVYKSWQFSSGSLEISVLEAEKGNNLSTDVTQDHHYDNGIILKHNHLEFTKHALWSQLRSQFYNPDIEYNPFYNFGDFSKEYTTNEELKNRYFTDYAKVISIPQKYFGENIKRGSVKINDGSAKYKDNAKGNLVRAEGYTVILNNLDLETNDFIFQDLEGNTYYTTGEVTLLDLNNGILNIVYQTIEYQLEIISCDLNDSRVVVVNIPFVPVTATIEKVGNVFYEHGLITITRKANLSFIDVWDLSYKSTQTIYEHEYLLTTNENEFNVSTNPTAVQEVGKVEEEIEVYDESNPTFIPYKVKTQPYVGTKYIKKLSYSENGAPMDYRYPSQLTSSLSGEPLAYGGFEHYDLSGSTDLTGSFLAPYITTIGLYDDDCTLLAVAKLAKPIKSLPDTNLNFIVRFDT